MAWPAVAAAGASALGSMESAERGAASQAAANEYNVAIEESRLRNQRNMSAYDVQAANEQAEYREDAFKPYTQAGARAVTQQEALMGLSGSAPQDQALQSFSASPGQRYLREQQEKARLRNASATGGLRSGRTQIALQEDAFGRAQTDYGNYFNRLSGLRDTGGQASAQLASQYSGAKTPPPEYSAIQKPEKNTDRTFTQNLIDPFKVVPGGGGK